MNISKTSLLAATFCALLALATPAAAQMGGGDMGGSEAPRRDPSEAYNAGLAAMEARNYAEAVRQFRSARRIAPNDPRINYALGVAYQAAGEPAEARTAFERTVRSNDAHPRAWLQLGLVALQLGDRPAAVAQQTALQQRIQNCDARCGDARRNEFQSAYNQLTSALATP